jgi:glutathione S-transferase
MSNLRDVLAYPTLAVAASLLVYQYQGALVGLARKKFNVVPPKTSGNEDFERVFRSHQNTLESLVVFVPSVYGFSYYVHPVAAGAIGGVYALGRLLYGLGYSRQSDKRSLGYLISFLASSVLLVGSAFGAGRQLLARCHH